MDARAHWPVENENKERFRVEIVRVRGVLMHYISTAIPNRSDAEDVFQEVCLKAWRMWENYEPGTNFHGWLLAIARFTILDHRKRFAGRRVVYLDADNLEALAHEIEDRLAERKPSGPYQEALEDCLGGMTRRVAGLMRRHYSDGYELADLAKLEGTSVSALKQLLYRSRIKLRECVSTKLGNQGS